MKHKYISTKILGFAALFLVLFSACEDFYDEPIEESINKELVFQNAVNAEKVLNRAYFQIPYKWPISWGSSTNQNKGAMQQAITACVTDEGVNAAFRYSGAALYYNGTLGPDNVGAQGDRHKIEHIFEAPYHYFRQAYLFLENIDAVPDASDEFKLRKKAEAKLLIAIGYFELIKRYGSVPWVDHVFGPTEVADETRPPLEELIHNVDTLIVEAIEGLPEKGDYNDANQGRVTKSAAHFLRSRLWLWAASPLFNADEPYLPFAQKELICLGESKDRWTKVVEVTEKAIEQCEKYHSLVKTGDPKADYTLATRDLIGNTEVVLFSRWTGTLNGKPGNNNHTLYGHYLPPGCAGESSGRLGFLGITQNFVEMYETVDGSTIDLTSDNPWKSLEPRFHASVIHDNADFGGTAIDTDRKETVGKGDDAKTRGNPKIVHVTTGYYLRKFLHEEHMKDQNLRFDPAYFYMRLPELYLNYAEALNEAPDRKEGLAKQYVDKIRERAGVAAIPAGLGYKDLQQVIQKERAIELAFEDQRMFDTKRWKIAAKTLGATKYGVRTNWDGTGYVKVECDAAVQRTWYDKYYLMPFPQYEVQKGMGLVQNPGY